MRKITEKFDLAIESIIADNKYKNTDIVDAVYKQKLQTDCEDIVKNIFGNRGSELIGVRVDEVELNSSNHEIEIVFYDRKTMHNIVSYNQLEDILFG